MGILLLLSIGIFGRESSIYRFEVNNVLCRFNYNYESVCADLQMNQIIVSVAPELFLARDFQSLCKWPGAQECFHMFGRKRDSHT